MVKNLTNEHYWEPPVLAGAPMKAVLAYMILVFFFATYMLFFKSNQLSKPYKRLMFYHLLLALCMEICLALLAFPHLQLPYPAVHNIGLLSDLSVSQLLQTELVVSLCLANCAAAATLFYYRMDVILPRGHLLNSQYVRFTVYIITYPILSLIPFPVFRVFYQDQNILKPILFDQFRVVYPDIFSKDIFAGVIDDSSPLVLVALSAFPLVVVFLLVLILGSCLMIIKILRRHDQQMSAKVRGHHISVMIGLTPFLLCFAVVGLGMACPLIFLIYTQSWRTEMANIAIFSGAVTAPCITTLCLVVYKPYRKIYIRLIRQEQATVTVLKS